MFNYHGFAQTMTQNYNSILNRYEYFDNTGRMVAYKSYNSMTGSWEYYNTSVQQSNYNPPVSSVNTSLVNQILQSKQSSYNTNYKKVADKVDRYSKIVLKLYQKNGNKYTNEQAKFIKSVQDYLNKVTKNQLTSETETYRILQTLDWAENTIINWL